jgi:3alpha(or 20beta)-hydroxysteroid dehydrogenase
MGRVDGKVAFISGGARGMGAAFAKILVSEGAQVVIGDLLDDDGAATAAALGDAAAYTHLDVTDRASWAAAIAVAVERFGRLDILVNNAGIANFGPIDQYTYEQWDSMIAINLTGVFNGMKAAIPELKKSGRASIINISSTAGLLGYPGLPGYNAAKFGVRGLSKGTAIDLAPYGIRVNSVHPGVVVTPMTSGLSTSTAHVAMNRKGEPEELAKLILFLASDDSSYSTGAEFVADGGEVAGRARNAT